MPGPPTLSDAWARHLIDEVFGCGFAGVHEHDEVGAAGDEGAALLQFGLAFERLANALGLVKHRFIMSTNLLTGKSQSYTNRT
jgi:hypothetical protein